MKILVVEDDEFTAYALKAILDKHRYTVEVAVDGMAAWELVQAFAYDLILLDVMLPKLDGIGLCQKLRAEGYRMPILLLTGRDSSHDKAVGLDAGADDYVIKPFSEEELMARIRALLRRGGPTAQPILEWGGLQLDPSTCEVSYKAQLLSLTPKEYGILELFLRNHHRVFNCGMILEHLWAYDEAPGEEAVRTHIKGLRHKLKVAGVPSDPIETVYGIGYRLKLLESSESSINQEKTHKQTLAAVAEVWTRFQKRVSEQIAVLEQAASALSEKALAQELQQRAIQEAHTLAGALGTFGFMEGSQRAREIEHFLQSKQEKEVGHLHTLVTALRQEINHVAAPSPSTEGVKH
jgi:DNA-binding response OmpR family regulator/HPt (histidine-containing phosphotransfer) domain-containing protein